jgi:hypothetical protein
VAAGLVVAMAAGAFFFLSTSGGVQEPALALGFSEGDRLRFRVELALDGTMQAPELGEQPMDVDMRLTVGMNVLSVDADGVADVEVSIRGGSIRANGQSVPVPDQERLRMRVAPDGRILKGGLLSSSAPSSGAGIPGMDQLAPLLPDGPVKPGESWRKEFSIPAPFGEGEVSYTSRNTLVKYDRFHGVRTAVVLSHVEAPFEFTMSFAEVAELLDTDASLEGVVAYDGEMVFDMSAWVGVKRGELLRQETTGTFDVVMSFAGVPGVPDGTEATFRGSMALDLTLL